VSGNVQNPIKFSNYNNELVILYGRGYEDKDLNGDGLADGPIGQNKEKILNIVGDYNIVSGLEFINSNSWGVYIAGNFNIIEHSSSHDNWENGFVIHGMNNTLRYLEAYQNRHRTGIEIRRAGT
jgi:hypothetical protein